ncbi:MAG: DUF4334 domain-containing protein [Spirochaetota bacterium]
MASAFDRLLTEAPDRDELLRFYDSLSPVRPNELYGLWHGDDWSTGGRFDGLLDRTGWYGKLFRSENDVEALIFSRPTTLLGVINYLMIWPYRVPEARRMVRHPLGRARLREVRFRGVVSAAMCYNYLPIMDHFRRVDERRVMGLMDFRGRRDSELFFWLERDAH